MRPGVPGRLAQFPAGFRHPWILASSRGQSHQAFLPCLFPSLEGNVTSYRPVPFPQSIFFLLLQFASLQDKSLPLLCLRGTGEDKPLQETLLPPSDSLSTFLQLQGKLAPPEVIILLEELFPSACPTSQFS